MIKSKIIQLFIAGTAGLLISCSIENNENSDQTINELKDGQQVILKKIASLEKSVGSGGSPEEFGSEKEILAIRLKRIRQAARKNLKN